MDNVINLKELKSSEGKGFAIIANILSKVKFAEGGILVPQEVFVEVMRDVANLTDAEAENSEKERKKNEKFRLIDES